MAERSDPDANRRGFLRLLGAMGVLTGAGTAAALGRSSGGRTARRTGVPAGAGRSTVDWTQRAKLAPEDGDSSDRFGDSVAVTDDGTTAVVGAVQDEDPNGTNAGSAYVFSGGDTWTEQSKLVPEGGDSEDRFGDAVAIDDDGTVVAIGASGDESPDGFEPGSTFVFSRNSGGTWTEEAKLVPDDGDAGDGFGQSVALSGDGSTVVVGAPLDDNENGSEAGAVYVFSASGDAWTQTKKFVASDGGEFDNFGESVAVSDDGGTVVVGASENDSTNGFGSGGAYVFSDSSGIRKEEAKLVPDDGDGVDWFGESVALSSDGTTAVVSAVQDEDPNGTRAGSAYVFSGTVETWTLDAKLVPDDGDASDRFGTSVDVADDGTTAVVSAVQDEDPNGTNAGSMYVFSGTDGGWAQDVKLAAAEGNADDALGWAVALSGDATTALAGARGDADPNGEGAGSAFVFGTDQQRTTTTPTTTATTTTKTPTTTATTTTKTPTTTATTTTKTPTTTSPATTTNTATTATTTTATETTSTATTGDTTTGGTPTETTSTATTDESTTGGAGGNEDGSDGDGGGGGTPGFGLVSALAGAGLAASLLRRYRDDDP